MNFDDFFEDLVCSFGFQKKIFFLFLKMALEHFYDIINCIENRKCNFVFVSLTQNDFSVACHFAGIMDKTCKKANFANVVGPFAFVLETGYLGVAQPTVVQPNHQITAVWLFSVSRYDLLKIRNEGCYCIEVLPACVCTYMPIFSRSNEHVFEMVRSVYQMYIQKKKKF